MTLFAASGRSRPGRSPSRVLCVGYDQKLLSQRAAILCDAGFDVAIASTLEDVRVRVSTGPYEALVIGHRVPQDVRNQIVEAARAQLPRVAVVLLYRERIRDASCADAVLSVDSGPRFLANSLQYLLQEAKIG